jgi:hypothetical protein
MTSAGVDDLLLSNSRGSFGDTMEPNGALYGEGQGVITTPQGDVIQRISAGRGHFTEQGGVSFRGAVYYQTTAERFGQLNRVAVVYEHEAGRDGSVVTKYWEWK